MENSTSDVDTAEPIVLPSPAPTWAYAQPGYGTRWLWWGIPLALVTTLLIGSLFITLPYFAIAPGTAPPVGAQLQVPKDNNYPPQGKFLLTTVSLSRVRPFGALRGWLDPDIDVVPEEQILGPTPPKNFRQQNVQEMDESILVAEVVALRKLGYTVAEGGVGALIVTVAKSSPADGHLKSGDVIKAVDNKPVRLSTDFINALAPKRFGDTVTLNVGTDGKPDRVEKIRMGGGSADKSTCSIDQQLTGKGCLGVSVTTKSHTFDKPIDVRIDANGIGGPSAGLAFVLAIMDQLRPGELTGGHTVAVTGTIDLDGTVGDVGGVAQKTAAVRHAGAEYFLVPPGEYKDALAHAGSKLKVIKVATLDEALKVLGGLGGDLASIAPTTTTTAKRARR